MRKLFIIAMVALVGIGGLRAQQTVVNVLTTSGESSERVLGETGVIRFSDAQMTVKDADGDEQGYDLGQVAKVTFGEKEVEPNGIDATESAALRLYPNPTRDVVRISGIGAEPQRVEVISMVGTLVLERRMSEGESLSLAGLPKGLYFVRCGAKTTKICKL